LSLIERGKFEYEVADFNSLCILISNVFEYVEYVLARRAYDILEDLLQEGYRFPDSLGYLIVLVPELNFLEDRERDRIDEDNATINARGVYDQYLLIVVREAQESRLCIVESVFVVHSNVVFATFIGTDGDSLLR
jgi:hypothetical protein